MENHLGRMLEDNEVVHHKKQNQKKNNKISNLQVKDKIAHLREHGAEYGRAMVVLKCPSCDKIFVREKGQTHLSKNGIFTSCSSSCRGKFSKLLQMYGRNQEINSAIFKNVVKQFNSLNKRYKRYMNPALTTSKKF